MEQLSEKDYFNKNQQLSDIDKNSTAKNNGRLINYKTPTLNSRDITTLQNTSDMTFQQNGTTQLNSPSSQNVTILDQVSTIEEKRPSVYFITQKEKNEDYQ